MAPSSFLLLERNHAAVQGEVASSAVMDARSLARKTMAALRGQATRCGRLRGGGGVCAAVHGAHVRHWTVCERSARPVGTQRWWMEFVATCTCACWRLDEPWLSTMLPSSSEPAPMMKLVDSGFSASLEWRVSAAALSCDIAARRMSSMIMSGGPASGDGRHMLT